MKINHYC